MRSWNNVTLDQITERVTTPLTCSKKGNSSWRRIKGSVAPAIVFTAIMMSSPAAQIQPDVYSNWSSSLAPTITVESSHRLRPAFLDQFKEFFDPAFIEKHKSKLDRVATLGSSVDTPGNSSGIITAISAFHDDEEWHPVRS